MSQSDDVSTESLTKNAQVGLWVTCAIFSAQAVFHWIRATCVAENARARQHELLAGSAAGSSALLYQGMACGLSLAKVAADAAGADSSAAAGTRVFFAFWYLERAASGSLVIVNIVALARERHPPALSVVSLFALETLALYFGCLAEGRQRLGFFFTAVVLLIPQGITLTALMGSRLRLSELQTTYRFLSTWFLCCSACYCLLFLLCDVGAVLDGETEVLAYALLDYCAIGVSSLVVSWASSDLQVGLLPAQEAELSLYPGPHHHGFFPNPDYYDDNL